MKFTVIIPSYNQGEFIQRTLESILRQDCSDIQVIVSDGGSKDETVNILKSYGGRITWWSERDKGFADAVNKALPLIDGEIVAIQSSDDYYLPGAFSYVANVFRDNEHVDFVCGRDVQIDLQYNVAAVGRRYSYSEKRITPANIFWMNIPQHATFMKREAFIALGGGKARGRPLRGLRSLVPGFSSIFRNGDQSHPGCLPIATEPENTSGDCLGGKPKENDSACRERSNSGK